MSSKLREALSDACYAMFNFLKTQNGGYEEMAIALDKAKATLATEPLRNCDVGTAEEQNERFRKSCKYLNAPPSQYRTCVGCPVHNEIAKTGNNVSCYLFWAQMPYEPAEQTKTTKGK